MMRYAYHMRLLLVCAVYTLLAAGSFAVAQVAPVQRFEQSTKPSPIRFTENRGQVVDMTKAPRPDVLFTAQSRDAMIFMRNTGLSYVFVRMERTGDPPPPSPNRAGRGPDTNATVHMLRMDMELVGANPKARVVRSEAAADRINYYLSHCPQGITDVRSFGRVVYRDIYPKIDLVYYGSETGMKYDFVVHPGGRASDIRMRYIGADSVRAADGRVTIYNKLGSVTEGAPKVWSQAGAATTQQPVRAQYVVNGSEIGFDVGAYDRGHVLVIDPTLAWCTYFGGSSTEYGWGWGGWGWGWGSGGTGVRADKDTTITFIGSTISSDLPTTPGVAYQNRIGPTFTYDLYIGRFSNRGNRVWATYFGGNNSEWSAALAIDTLRNVYIGGATYSNDLPVTIGAFNPTRGAGFWEGFMAKLDDVGQLVWCTYYNGAGIASLATDRNGDLLVGGAASSTFTTTPGAFQTTPPAATLTKGFLAKFTSGGGRIWATFFGGTPVGSNTDNVVSVATDTSRAIYAAGTTTLATFPVTVGAFQTTLRGGYDAWVAKLDPDGNRLWATLYGGLHTDYAGDVVVDSKGHPILVGSTNSGDLSTTPGGFQPAYSTTPGTAQDAFIARFAPDGATLKWATYYGGASNEYGAAADIDGRNNFWIGISAWGTGFPVTADAFQSVASNFYDCGVVKFDTAGNRLYSTYFGGNAWDYLDGVAATLYGCILFGTTASSNMPTNGSSFQQSLAGPPTGYDSYLAMFCDVAVVATASGPIRFCQGDSVILTASPGFDRYRWSNGVTATSIVVKQSGIYSVTADFAVCSGVSEPVMVIVDPTPIRRLSPGKQALICEGDSVVLTVPGGIRSYRWSTGDTTKSLTVRAAGSYYLLFTDTAGCTNRSDTCVVTVSPLPRPVITADGPLSFCEGKSVRLSTDPGLGTYRWSNGETSASIVVDKPGSYSVVATNPDGCVGPRSNVMNVVVFPAPTVALRPLLPTTFCEGDSTILVPTPTTFVKYLWSNGAMTQNITVKEEGSYKLIATDTNGCEAVAEMRVTVTPRPRPKLDVSGPTRFCRGDSVILSVTGAIQYQWSNGSTASSIVAKEPGKYFVTVTNDRGCIGTSDTVTLEVLPLPVAVINGPVLVCVDAVTDYSVPTVPGQSYEWSLTGSGAITSATNGPSVTVAWGSSGSGTVRVRVVNDSTGCRKDTMLRVVIGNALVPAITANRSLTLCVGDSVTLDAGAYARYRWSNGAMTRTITVNTPGTYTVDVADAKGCAGTSEPVEVRVSAPPTPAITASGPLELCAGDSVVLDAGPYARYRWSNGFTTRTITVRTGGDYVVTVVDTNGCEGTSPAVAVVGLPVPQPPINGPGQVCQNSVVAYSTPATPGSTYTWAVTGGVLTAGQGTPTATVQWGGLGTGRVTLNERTVKGCAGDAIALDVTIGDKLVPVITPSGPVALCPGGTVRLDAGAGYATYSWSNGATTQAIDVNAAGQYTVTVADASGCSGTSLPVDVVDHAAPTPEIVANGPLAFCEGDSVLLSVKDAYASYEWSTGATTRSIRAKVAGTYSVRARDSVGCEGVSPAVSVVVHPLPAVPVIAGVDAQLSTNAVASGYQWSVDGVAIAGATSSTHTAAGAGMYRVVVVSADGCSRESAPYWYGGSARPRLVWLDTASSHVGERRELVARVSPALEVADSVVGYRAVVRLDREALFVHSVVWPDGTRGGAVWAASGDLEVTRANGGVVTGPELFRLEYEGLVTGRPLNVVELVGIEFAGRAAGGQLQPGLVLLSGCEIGTGFTKVLRVQWVRPQPASAAMVVRYRAERGAAVELRLVDGLGRAVVRRELGPGTGEYEEAHLNAGDVSSGLYQVELRSEGDRSVMPIVIVK